MFEKIFKSDIFTTKTIERQVRDNTKLYKEMLPQEKTSLLESLKEISSISNDFKDLRNEHLDEAKSSVNMASFKEYIKNAKSGYYYRKIFYFFFIRAILMIPQFIFTIRFFNPKYICTKESIGKKDKKFWVSDDKHYKVTELEKYREFPLRLIIFAVDAIFTICKFFVLKNLERIKADVCYVISAQLIKFICIVIIIVPDFSREYCESSSNDKNLFYIRDNTLEKIMNIYEIIKYFIN